MKNIIQACWKGRKGFFLVLAMVLGGTIQESKALTYQDTKGHWAESSINHWTDLGIMTGVNGYFYPETLVTRGEMALVLDRIMDYQVRSGNTFVDLPSSANYYDAVLKVKAADIMVGKGSYFSPNQTLSRQEASLVLANGLHLDYTTVEYTGFVDDGKIADWAKAAVSLMRDEELITGTGGNFFSPYDPISRAALAVILDNAIDIFIHESGTYSQDTTGNVVVNTPSVTLHDSHIQGNLILSEGVAEGNVTLRHVRVDGNLVIKGGGNYSIYVDDTTVSGTIHLEKATGSVRLVFSGNSEADLITLGSSTRIDAAELGNYGSLGELQINGGSAFTIEGDFLTITNNSNAASLAIDGDIRTVANNGSSAKLTVSGDVEMLSNNGNSASLYLNAPVDILKNTGDSVYFSVDDNVDILNNSGDSFSLYVDDDGRIDRLVSTGESLKVTNDGSIGSLSSKYDYTYNNDSYNGNYNGSDGEGSGDQIVTSYHIYEGHVDSSAEGNYVLSHTSATPGTTVSITANSGCTLYNVSVTNVYEGSALTVSKNSSNNLFTFVMPESPVYVSIDLCIATIFNITANETDNGTVTLSHSTAGEGDSITVTAEPEGGYVVGSVTVTGKNGTNCAVKSLGNNEYSFTMPKEHVTVVVYFTADTTASVTVTGDVTSLAQGETTTLTATVGGAAYGVTGTITWTSNDNSVATVDDDGTVTAVSVGMVSITATWTESNPENGENPLTAKGSYGIEVTQGVYAIGKESTSNGSFKVTLNDAEVSSAPVGSVVTINTTAELYYIADSITVTGESGDTYTITKKTDETYTFQMPAENVTVSVNFAMDTIARMTLTTEDGSTVLGEDETMQLIATVGGLGAGKEGTFIWSTSDYKVATVSETGLVTPATIGTVTITAKWTQSGVAEGATPLTATASIILKVGQTIFDITKAATENGSFTVTDSTGTNVTTSKAGSTITITPTPANSDCEVESVTVTRTGTTSSVATSTSDGKVFTFTMPEGAVTVTVKFKMTTELALKLESDLVGSTQLEPSDTVTLTPKLTITLGDGTADTRNGQYTLKSSDEKVAKAELLYSTGSDTEQIKITCLSEGETTVAVTWTEIRTDGGEPLTVTETYDVTVYATSYKITSAVTPTTGGGSVTLGKETARSGDKVNFTITTTTGYVLDTVTVTGGGEEVETVLSGSAYTFTMPEDDVNVTVKFVDLKDISVTITQEDGKTEVNQKETLALTATVSGLTNPDQSVSWSSSDTKIATVSTAGVVTGVAGGDVEITATWTGSNTVTSTYDVKVIQTIFPITKVDTTNGSFTVQDEDGKTVTEGTVGKTYTIVPKANDHYLLENVTVKEGTLIATPNDDGTITYTFVMGSQEETVEVTFKAEVKLTFSSTPSTDLNGVTELNYKETLSVTATTTVGGVKVDGSFDWTLKSGDASIYTTTGDTNPHTFVFSSDNFDEVEREIDVTVEWTEKVEASPITTSGSFKLSIVAPPAQIVYKEEELMVALADENIAIIEIDQDMEISENLIVPKDKTLILRDTATLTVFSQLTVEGSLQNEGVLETANDGALTLEDNDREGEFAFLLLPEGFTTD